MSNAELIADTHNWHLEMPGFVGINGGKGYCNRCSESWPCRSTRLSAALKKSEAEVVRLGEVIGQVDALVRHHLDDYYLGDICEDILSVLALTTVSAEEGAQ